MQFKEQLAAPQLDWLMVQVPPVVQLQLEPLQARFEGGFPQEANSKDRIGTRQKIRIGDFYHQGLSWRMSDRSVTMGAPRSAAAYACEGASGAQFLAHRSRPNRWVEF